MKYLALLLIISFTSCGYYKPYFAQVPHEKEEVGIVKYIIKPFSTKKKRRKIRQEAIGKIKGLCSDNIILKEYSRTEQAGFTTTSNGMGGYNSTPNYQVYWCIE